MTEDTLDILGIVVLYNCEISNSLTLTSLNKSLIVSGKVMRIIIYDNSTKEVDKSQFPLLSNCIIDYVHDPTNPGVSKAYNHASLNCKRQGIEWMLLLDQDTIFPENSIKNFCDGIMKFSNEVLFAPILYVDEKILSPNVSVFKKSFTLNKIFFGINSLSFRNFFNSGLLIKNDAFVKVGGYNEKTGLYFSDYSFVSRLKRYYNTYVLINVKCSHDMNSNKETNLVDFVKTYEKYIEGAYFAGETFNEKLQYFLLAGFRSIKMVIKYRNYIFVKMFISRYFG